MTSAQNASSARLAREARALMMEVIANRGATHVASALSVLEILAAIYAVTDAQRIRQRHPDRTRVLLSKAHGALSLYAVLATCGVIQRSAVGEYGGPNSPVHPERGVTDGIEFSSGSLGNGLGTAVGIAHGLSLRGSKARTFAILGDGECQEGSIWESAMFAATLRRLRLTIIVDCNGLQQNSVTALRWTPAELLKRFTSMGLPTKVLDGHDLSQLDEVVLDERLGAHCVIARTVKGRGLSDFEGNRFAHFAAFGARSGL